MTLGSELRKWRERKGWSQEKAADFFGVSQAAYYKWESDKGRLALRNFRVLRRKLRGVINVDALA